MTSCAQARDNARIGVGTPPATPTRRVGGVRARSYIRRTPEESAVYRAVAEHLQTFLARAEDSGRSVPRFVEHELRSFLDCGLLCNGFRVRCPDCRHERLVAFSCKGRGLCPSCGGRRMAETAAHLVDRVIPEVPVRQWVLSLPMQIRHRIAYDWSLCSAVLRIFVRALFGHYRRRAKAQLGELADGAELHPGAVTFVQRFGDALNLNPHFHTPALDGVYVVRDGRLDRFLPLPPPGDAEVERLVKTIRDRVMRLLHRRGVLEDGVLTNDDDEADDSVLKPVATASVLSVVAVGEGTGHRVERLGRSKKATTPEPGSMCARIDGFSLHGGVAVPARDRKRLELLLRYAARPPIASERLSVLEDGRIAYRFKRRFRDGSTHAIFDPVDFIGKLVALIPPPHVNLTRYHGCLAPRSKVRAKVVRDRRSTQLVDPGTMQKATPPQPGASQAAASCAPLHPRRDCWAELMQRVLEIDVLDCPRCHGRMKIIATIEDPKVARKILAHLGLPTEPPPLVGARDPPQLELDLEEPPWPGADDWL